MAEQGLNRNMLKKNMAYAFLAQGVALLLSLIMALILPKILNVTAYGYWQLFIFYASYAGLFHFGFNDGIYLRFGGRAYEEIDLAVLGTEWKIWTSFQILIAIVLALFAVFCIHDAARVFTVVAFSLYMVIYNACYFIGYLFQAVNQTRLFSLAEMINKGAFIFCIVTLILFGVNSFRVFICFYILCLILSLFFYLYQGRSMVFSFYVGWKKAFRELFQNISIGVKLLFANLAGMFILGIGRIVIDWLWGIESFGRVSFSLTLTNFFLVFIAQVSMVLFPALRQTDEACQERYYGEIDDFLSILLPCILLFYIPIKEILMLWLPQYALSLAYLAVLLPLCLFDGKMQLLCSTYLKVLRKEKVLFHVNIAACLFSLILCCISGFVLQSMDAIVLSMLIAVTLRYVLSEIYLARIFQRHYGKGLLSELLLVGAFVGVSWFCSAWLSFVIVLLLYGIYLLYHKKETQKVFTRLLRR